MTLFGYFVEGQPEVQIIEKQAVNVLHKVRQQNIYKVGRDCLSDRGFKSEEKGEINSGKTSSYNQIKEDLLEKRARHILKEKP